MMVKRGREAMHSSHKRTDDLAQSLHAVQSDPLGPNSKKEKKKSGTPRLVLLSVQKNTEKYLSVVTWRQG